MTERYTRVFSLPENLYAAGSPLLIRAGALLKDNQTGRILAQLKFKSLSPKTIKAVKVKIFPLDTVNKPLDGEFVYEYLDLCVVRDGEFGQKIPIFLPNASTRAFAVEVAEVDFADNSAWTSQGEAWKPLPAAKPVVGDPELIKQYKLHYGGMARYSLVQYKGGWICACGALNGEKEIGCHVCGNLLSNLLACDMKDLEAEKEERLAKERAEREDQAAAEKAAAEAQARKTKKVLSVAVPTLLVCVALFFLLTKVIIPNQKYNAAVELYTAEKYEDAIAEFIALDGYKDSVAQIEKCETAIKDREYVAAVELYTAEKYEDAIAAFTALEGYRDSAEKANEIFGKYKVEKLKTANVGDIVYFGAYEQDNNTSNGEEDIEWLILAKEGNKALVISKYALDCQQYNTSWRDVTWETCSLRKWLNGTFLNAAFSAAEQSCIPSSIVTADNNPSYSTSPGNNTTDKVFLLSITEVNKYFSSDSARQCSATAYAKAQGAYTNTGKGNCEWWLRSPGGYSSNAAPVNYDGSVDSYGVYVDNIIDAVRPALWINLGL